MDCVAIAVGMAAALVISLVWLMVVGDGPVSGATGFIGSWRRYGKRGD